MKKALSLCLAAAIVAPAAAQQVIPLPIYAPARSVKDQKIQLQGWGSGTISETDGVSFAGVNSVRVSSRNYFQGGTMIFGEPKDLAAKYEDKSNLLKLTFFLEDAGFVYGADALNGGHGRGAPDIVGGGGGGAKSIGRGKGGPPSRVVTPPFKPKIKNVRMIFTTTDGKKSEAYIPVLTSQGEGGGWRSISIPLQAINGFDRTNKTIKDISVSSDTVATMYIGALQVMNDTTPIKGEVKIDKLNLALGDEVTLTGYGEGGSSVLVFQWDFDDRDGIQVDAEGQVVKRKFRTPGKFNVTLTVADKYGLKQPYKTSFPVVVNP